MSNRIEIQLWESYGSEAVINGMKLWNAYERISYDDKEALEDYANALIYALELMAYYVPDDISFYSKSATLYYLVKNDRTETAIDKEVFQSITNTQELCEWIECELKQLTTDENTEQIAKEVVDKALECYENGEPNVGLSSVWIEPLTKPLVMEMFESV